MSETVKVGVIGCGKIGERHITAYKKIPDVEVYACDFDENLVSESGRTFNIPWDTNYESLIQNGGLKAIDVCTPTPTHKEIIKSALESGIKHIFCEKPLAGSLEEMKEIYEEVKKHNAFLTTGYLYRFHPSFAFVKEVLDEGIIGLPHFANFRLGGRGSHKEWKHKKGAYGGSILDMMVHMLDLTQWYFGDITKVEKLYEDVLLKTREIEGKRVEADAEDVILAKLTTSYGVNVICESDLITPAYSNYIEIQGSNGSIFCSILHYFPTIVFCKEPRGIYNQGHNFYNFPQTNVFLKELGYFVDYIRGNNDKKINNVEESLKIMRIVEELRRH